MQHIFVDFEMNAIPKKNTEARAVYRSEIIEIGAVKLNEQYQQVGKYSRYVHPVLADITPRTTEITGITGEDVQGAKDLPEALAEFIEWIGRSPAGSMPGATVTVGSWWENAPPRGSIPTACPSSSAAGWTFSGSTPG